MKICFFIIFSWMILSGCAAIRIRQSAPKPRYFAEMDLLKLDFKGSLQNGKTLPFIKVTEDSIGKLRVDFYFKFRKRPLKTGYLTSSNGKKILTTRTFDGKIYTNDTLVSDGNRMIEFRYENYDKHSIRMCKVFYYELIKPDSIDLRYYFWFNDNQNPRVIRPTIDLECEELNHHRIYQAQSLYTVKNTVKPYSLYWSLFLMSPFMSMQPPSGYWNLF